MTSKRHDVGSVLLSLAVPADNTRSPTLHGKGARGDPVGRMAGWQHTEPRAWCGDPNGRQSKSEPPDTKRRQILAR